MFKTLNEKKNVFEFLFISNIIACLISITSSVFLKNNSFENEVLIAFHKGLVMLIILLIACFNFYFFKRKERTRYKKFIVIALTFSTLSDICIVFNFIIGGIFSAIALCLFSFAFLNYTKLKKSKLKIRILSGLFSAFLCFFSFMIFFIFVLSPKIEPEFYLFNILFPIYIFIQSLMVGAAFFGRVPILVRFAAIVFFISDVLLFYKAIFGESEFLVAAGLLIYLFAQNLFAINIDD